MFLIIGLGNPGDLYLKTRHNAGFSAIDVISDDYKLSWNHKLKFNAYIANGIIGDYKVVMCKPTTFMNLSGNALLPIISYYKIERKNIIVIHDDIDLDLGAIKCKIGGGAAGHNGLKSIDNTIGQDYCRIRIGVGRPQDRRVDIADYVLGRFSNDDLSLLEKKYNTISQNIELLLDRQFEKFQLLYKVSE